MKSGAFPVALIWIPGSLHYYESLSSLAAKYALYNLCQPAALVDRLQLMRGRRERIGKRGRSMRDPTQRLNLNNFDWSTSVLRRIRASLGEPIDRITSMAIPGVFDSPLVAFRGRVCWECLAEGFHSWMHTIEGIDACFIHHTSLGVHLKQTAADWRSHQSLASDLRDYWQGRIASGSTGLRVIGGTLSQRPDPQVEQFRFALVQKYTRSARNSFTFHSVVDQSDSEGGRRRWRAGCRRHACCADAAHLKLLDTPDVELYPKPNLMNWIIPCSERERDAILGLTTADLTQLVAARQLHGLWVRRPASLPSISGTSDCVKDHQCCVERFQANLDSTRTKYFPVLADVRILLFPALTSYIFNWISCPALVAIDLVRAAALPAELIAQRAYGLSGPSPGKRSPSPSALPQLDRLFDQGLMGRASITSWCPVWPWISYRSDDLFAPWSCTGLPDGHPAYGYPVSSTIEVPTGALGQLCDLLITQHISYMQAVVTEFLRTYPTNRSFSTGRVESIWRSLLAPYALPRHFALSAVRGGVQLTRDRDLPRLPQVTLNPTACAGSSVWFGLDYAPPESIVDALVAQCDKRNRSVEWRRFLTSIGVHFWRSKLDAWGNPLPASWC